jgi:hypothetical protein
VLEAPSRAVHLLHAGARAVQASIHIAWLFPRLPFDQLAANLRQSRVFPAGLADPRHYAQVVALLLPLLPPWGMGRCLKRSLLLVRLWSRCGLVVELHVGVRLAASGERIAHAWVTATPGGRDELVNDCTPFPATWSL